MDPYAMCMYRVCREFRVLPWEFRELDEFRQGELVGLVMPDIKRDLERAAEKDGGQY